MKSLETFLPSAGNGQGGKKNLEALVLKDWEPKHDGDIHPLVERDAETTERLESLAAAEQAKTNVRDLEFDVPMDHVEAALDTPGLDPHVAETIPDVVKDPNLWNPNQHLSGAPMLRRGTREATPMSEAGLAEFRTVPGSTVHGRGSIATMGELALGRDVILEERHAGVGAPKKAVRPVTEDAQFIQAAGADLLNKGLKDDWQMTRQIVADQQAGSGLAAFRGRVIDPGDEWKRKQAESRASLVKSSDEGLGMFKTHPAQGRVETIAAAPGKQEKLTTLREQGRDLILELRQRVRDERKPFTTKLLDLDLDISQLQKEMAAEKDEKKLVAMKKVLANLEAERTGLHQTMTAPSATEIALARAEETYRRNFGDIEL